MEIKGEKIYLSKEEVAATDYPTPLSFSDVLDLRQQQDQEVRELISLRADDGLTSAERAMLVARGPRLDARGILLENIRKQISSQQGTPEEELEGYIIRGQII